MTDRIAILGAGPAGSLAAFHLARAGFAVTILESRPFPRVKVCGEFVSPAAAGILEEAIPPADLAAAGAVKVHEFVLECGTRERAFPLPAPAWGLSRASLDTILLDRAKAAGAHVIQPCTVLGVDAPTTSRATPSNTLSIGGTGVPPVPNGPGVTHTRDARATANAVVGDSAIAPARVRLKDADPIYADLVIHADGSGRFDAAGPTPMTPGLVGQKCHFTCDRPLPGVRIRAALDAYIGTIQVEQGLGTCALVARADLVSKFQGNAGAMVRALWTDCPPSLLTADWKSCGVPRSRYITPASPRSIRIGNAAAAVDPIGGEGIGLALWSARIASAAIIESHASTTALTAHAIIAAERTLAHAYATRLRTRLPFCRAAAAMLMKPTLIASLWPLLSMSEWSIQPWFWGTGKRDRSDPSLLPPSPSPRLSRPLSS
jgi:menaquinone-9 beta-reductase